MKNNQDLCDSYYEAFATTQAGQIVLQDMEARFYASDISVQNDSHATSFNLGMREVVRYILNELVKSESKIPTVLGEQ